MAVKEFNWKNYHHSLYQIYHGFIALTLVPFALLFLSWDSGSDGIEVDYSSSLFIAIAQLLWLVAICSWYVWKGEKVKYRLNEDLQLEEKLREFKLRNTYKFLGLAIGGLVAVFAMWIQPSFIFVLSYFSILIQFSVLRPSEDKIVRDMRLTKSDRAWIHQKA